MSRWFSASTSERLADLAGGLVSTDVLSSGPLAACTGLALSDAAGLLSVVDFGRLCEHNRWNGNRHRNRNNRDVGPGCKQSDHPAFLFHKSLMLPPNPFCPFSHAV